MALIKVLIVDDSLTIRAMMEQVISQDAECEVVGIAADVATAHALIRSTQPDVITLDLSMPGIDGLHFLDELADRRHAPVLVVSSATKEGAVEVEEAIAHGADGCFDKAKVISDAPRFLRLLKKAARRKDRRARQPLKAAD